MSNYGALKTLFTMLQSAPTMGGVNLAFGEEMINAQEPGAPYVVMVPQGGAWREPGYIRAVDPATNVIWATDEVIELYLWAFDTDPQAQPIDHADAAENLTALVLQALQFQQAPGGLKYVPQSGRWLTMANGTIRAGRCYVLSVMVEKGIPDVAPINATVKKTTLSQAIV